MFRFPAVPDAQATLRREMALLPHLRAALALRVPFFEHVGKREDGALLFVGYRVVSGVALSAERFEGLGRDAQEAALAALAGFLQALHGVSLDLARRAGVVEEPGKGAYNRGQRHLHRRLARLLSPAELARLDGIFERLPATRRTPDLGRPGRQALAELITCRSVRSGSHRIGPLARRWYVWLRPADRGQ